VTKSPLPTGWTPVEAYAAESGVPAESLIRLLEEGALEGAYFAGAWYVAPPLVSLECQFTPGSTSAELIFSACRLGPYLTAGRARHVITLDLEDARPLCARAALDEAMTQAPTLPLPIELGGRPWLIDSSLWCDLAAALAAFEVLQTGAISGIPVSDEEEQLP